MERQIGRIFSLLASLIVISTLSLTPVPALAQDVYYTDWEYSTWHQYGTYGDFIFSDSQVTGYRFWQAGVDYHSHPRPPIGDRGWEVTLDSDLDLTWNSMSQDIEIPDFERSDGTYKWTFEQVDPIIFVHPVAPIPVDFTPKFDASRTVDMTTFLQSEGTQSQTLTVSITPQQNPGVPTPAALLVAVEENDEFPIIPAENIDESDLVDAQIISGPSGAGILDNGSLLFRWITNEEWQVGAEITFDVGIEVTPNVAEAEFMPEVWILLYGVTGIEAGTYDPGTSHSHSVDSLATWTWVSDVVFEGTWTDYDTESVAFLGYSNDLSPIEAIIDLNPDTLNLKSKGKWITCYIELPQDYDVGDINVSTVELTYGEVGVSAAWGDVQDGALMVKFNRSDVQDMLEPGDDVEVTVSGELTNGTPFEGTDMIKVIN